MPSLDWMFSISVMYAVKRLLRAVFGLLMKIPFLREKAIFLVKYHYFKELGFSMPIGAGYHAPLLEVSSVHAFSEIFVNQEYADLLKYVPLPRSWVDIGCHRGYFSLWLARHSKLCTAKDDCEAILIDADPRAEAWVGSLVAMNALQESFHWVHGAVGDNDRAGTVCFALREGMLSSNTLNKSHPLEHCVEVPCLDTKSIHERFGLGFDVLKIDIEGAEYAFVHRYTDIIQLARSVVVEWHAYGQRLDKHKSEAMLNALGFNRSVVLRPVGVVHCEDQVVETEVMLYLR